jgi:hypothetical protein
MDKMTAYCGLVCTDCEAFLATQANDWAALEQMATKAREEYGVPDASAESVLCDGCLSSGGHLSGYCLECLVRACGMKRNVLTCAHCDDYACEKLEAFWAMAPDARTMLDSIRTGLHG